MNRTLLCPEDRKPCTCTGPEYEGRGCPREKRSQWDELQVRWAAGAALQETVNSSSDPAKVIRAEAKRQYPKFSAGYWLGPEWKLGTIKWRTSKHGTCWFEQSDVVLFRPQRTDEIQVYSCRILSVCTIPINRVKEMK